MSITITLSDDLAADFSSAVDELAQVFEEYPDSLDGLRALIDAERPIGPDMKRIRLVVLDEDGREVPWTEPRELTAEELEAEQAMVDEFHEALQRADE